MKFTRNCLSNIGKMLDFYSQFNPSPLSIKQFIDFGEFFLVSHSTSTLAPVHQTRIATRFISSRFIYPDVWHTCPIRSLHGLNAIDREASEFRLTRCNVRKTFACSSNARHVWYFGINYLTMTLEKNYLFRKYLKFSIYVSIDNL